MYSFLFLNKFELLDGIWQVVPVSEFWRIKWTFSEINSVWTKSAILMYRMTPPNYFINGVHLDGLWVYQTWRQRVKVVGNEFRLNQNYEFDETVETVKLFL